VKDPFEEVRRTAPADAWSKGVTLARGGSVRLESDDGEEIVARVAVPGSPLTPRVSLYPGDGAWECDCGSVLEACEHVAAVVIARRHKVASSDRKSPIEYRLFRSPEGIRLERGVEIDSRFQAIEIPLDRLTDTPFEASPEDFEIEKALRGNYRGPIERGAAPRVLEALSRSRNVTLDGSPIRVSAEPMVRPIVVEDAEGQGFLLHLGELPGEGFRNGIALASGFLRPASDPSLSGREWEELTRGRFYRPDEVGELVGSVLPSLKGRASIEVRTRNLAGVVRERPRLSLRMARHGNSLYVLPEIVYGDPPRARVEGERLVALGGDVPLRDLDAERKLEERLSRELGFSPGRGEELEADDAVALVAKLDVLDGLEVGVEGIAHEAFRLQGELSPRLTLEASDFALSFETAGRRADPKAVFRAFREGRSLVPLLESGFAKLPLSFLERYGEAIEDLLLAREERGKLARASLFDLARLADELDTPRPPEFEALRALAEDFSQIPEAPIPESLRGQLRDYQKRGVDWLHFLKRAGLGALLADDMGLGKTIQALAALEGRSLVVAPTSVLRNWAEEARRFRPDLSQCLYHGNARTLDPAADLTVTSHALLRLDRELLTSIPWDVVVLDEGQAIRNPETDLARAAFSLDARFRVSLTGTPIENRLLDLWSQFHFLNPGFLGSLSSFEERTLRPVERGDAEPLERLRHRIRPFFLRRLKREVAPELPPRTESILTAELGANERDLYDALKLAARKDVVEKLEGGGSALAVLEALLRLRQAACHPALVPGQSASTSSKTELLLSSLETAVADQHKSLVFSQWTSMLDLLEPKLTEKGFRFVRLDGSTIDRSGVVRRFQEDHGISVFLLSLKAGGVGLNLTAADHVFLFDPWWNPAVEEQAFDRAHRIGQEKPVFVYRLVAADTVEERILDLQKEKRALADLASAGSATALTREEILRLLT
jgi:superfamily II DNA or RNA helicase